MRRSCFPNSGSHQHGPPLLGRVRAPLRSPTSKLLCSPPTPSLPSAAAPVVPRKTAYLGAQVLFFTAAPVPPQTGATPETFLPRLPTSRLSPEEKRRGSQVPGPSSSGVPWSTTPPGAYRPSPILRCGRRRLQTNRSPRHPASLPISGLPTHGPHARVPTHRRTRYRSRRKARYRPGRAHPWPGGIRTRWMTNKVS